MKEEAGAHEQMFQPFQFHRRGQQKQSSGAQLQFEHLGEFAFNKKRSLL